MKQKIKIPDGYEIDESNEKTIHIVDGELTFLHIPVKKKEPKHKSFEDYCYDYLKRLDSIFFNKGLSKDIREKLESYPLNGLIAFWAFYENKEYNKIPFEFRIGLLKFICDDLFGFKIKGFGELLKILPDFISEHGSINDRYTEKIRNICPKEFLETFK